MAVASAEPGQRFLGLEVGSNNLEEAQDSEGDSSSEVQQPMVSLGPWEDGAPVYHLMPQPTLGILFCAGGVNNT